MASIAQTVTPQGIAAVCHRLDVTIDEALAKPPRLVTVLVDARDPGNTGTVIRTADAAGADAIVLTGGSVDPYNGKCVRATAGSIFHVPLVVAGPVEPAVDRLREAGLGILAADGAGDVDLDTALDSGSLERPTAWLFGNEAWGLPDRRPGPGRRRDPGPDPRPGREPQPGRRGRGVPVRLGSSPPTLNVPSASLDSRACPRPTGRTTPSRSRRCIPTRWRA